MKATTAYKALRSKADNVGWPAHYRADLTKHDRLRLCRSDAPKRFGWVLRELGTELLDTRMPRKILESYLGWYSPGTDGKHFHLFDGMTLREVAFEDFAEMLRQWNESDEDTTDNNHGGY